MIACDTTEALLRRIDSKALTVTLDRPLAAVPDALLARFNAHLAAPDRLRFQYAPSQVHGGDILTAVGAEGLRIVEVSTREAELEDIFLALTGATAPALDDVDVTKPQPIEVPRGGPVEGIR